MDEKELKKLTEDLNKRIGEFQESVEKKANQEDVDKLINTQDQLRKDISALPNKEEQGKMQEQLDLIERKVSDIAIVQGSSRENLDAQFEKMFKSEEYQKASQRKGISATFELKADTITTANSFTQTNSPIIPYYRDQQLGIAPRAGIIMTNLVTKLPVGTSDTIDWVERTAETTGTKMTAEDAVFGQSDMSWTSYKLPIELISDYVKVSRLKLADTDFIRGEIMSLLQFNLPHKLETQLFDGTGGSNTLVGVIGGSKAKTFAIPTGTAAVTNSNQFDAIRAAIMQVIIGASSAKTDVVGGFDVNGILVHPIDFFNMMSNKDNVNNYVFGFDGIPRILGTPVYQSQRLDAGTFLVGDFAKYRLYLRQALEINMWDQNENDAIYNRVTFTATQRACLVIKGVDTYAGVTGTFAAAKTLLDAGNP